MTYDAFDPSITPRPAALRAERAPVSIRAAGALPLAARLEALWLTCVLVAVASLLPLVMLLHR